MNLVPGSIGWHGLSVVDAPRLRAIMECLRGGGEVVVPERTASGGRTCVIRDPAGAFCTLYQVV
jgi:hypothetical protein